MKNKNFLLFRNPINLAFLISIFYWTYLFLTSRMSISCDAVTYESLGKTLAQQGWVEFFKIGPNREPLYPALVAFSMGLGKAFGISYQSIQVLIQLLLLFLTQILILQIMRLLKINKLITALTILYLGISPAIVNSALSLFSEIITYPLILAVMLLTYKSWISLTGRRGRIFLLAIPAGLLFAALTLAKGIFEVVTPVFLFLFIVSAFFTLNRKIIINILLYSIVFSAVFYPLVNTYKALNKRFNGHFVVTDRGEWVVYGYTVQRTEPLTTERFLAGLAYVPGEGVCKSIFGEQKCSFWDFRKGSRFGMEKMQDLINTKTMSTAEVRNTLIWLAKERIQQNPAQYILLTAMEGAKMFFWESSQMGFVEYPPGLTKLFSWGPFKNGLRLGISFLLLLVFVCAGTFFWKERKTVLKTENPSLFSFAEYPAACRRDALLRQGFGEVSSKLEERRRKGSAAWLRRNEAGYPAACRGENIGASFIYFCLLFIFAFVGCYSLLLIIPRYILPVAPLHLVIAAYVFQKILLNKKTVFEETSI